MWLTVERTFSLLNPWQWLTTTSPSDESHICGLIRLTRGKLYQRGSDYSRLTLLRGRVGCRCGDVTHDRASPDSDLTQQCTFFHLPPSQKKNLWVNSPREGGFNKHWDASFWIRISPADWKPSNPPADDTGVRHKAGFSSFWGCRNQAGWLRVECTS